MVLFVHGVSVPSVPDFDLPFRDYSWMAYLANAGFDTFAMDHTGYGYSPQPEMGTPCNLPPDDRAALNLGSEVSCEDSYEFELTGSGTDWDEIDTVVDYIRQLRNVDQVHLIGWSLGGLRAGGYAARHADKIDRVVLFAPVFLAGGPTEQPANFPASSYPMTLQSRSALMDARWGANVACPQQLEPGIQDAVWQSIMSFDRQGSIWADGGIMRVRTASYWGWNPTVAANMTTPTLILVGRQDGLLPAADALYQSIGGTPDKVLVKMDCATHFAVWEKSQYRFMHEASREWLNHGQFRGQTSGEYDVGFDGVAEN